MATAQGSESCRYCFTEPHQIGCPEGIRSDPRASASAHDHAVISWYAGYRVGKSGRSQQASEGKSFTLGYEAGAAYRKACLR